MDGGWICRPWDVPEKYFAMYPNVSLADHNQPPLNYEAARNYSWDPQVT